MMDLAPRTGDVLLSITHLVRRLTGKVIDLVEETGSSAWVSLCSIESEDVDVFFSRTIP
jgi:hypothetical protein